MIRYNYPFESVANYKIVRLEKCFSIQNAIDATKGTIFEVGGPTFEGYFFLRSCSLPRRPVITNKTKHGGKKDKESQHLAKKYIEELIDIRKAKVQPASAGICLASSLDLLANEPPTQSQALWQKAWEKLANEDTELLS